MKVRLPLFLAASVIACSTLAAGPAGAVPAFSRQLKTECKTCHTIIPERNEFGDAFEKNSFVWPSETVAQGQPAQPLDKGTEAIRNTGIPENIPIAFLGQHDVTYNKNEDPELNLNHETELEVFAAGSFKDLAGFWAEYNFEPDGELGELFIQFRRPLDLPTNVKTGKFIPRLSLWKPNDRVTISKYGYNKLKVDGNDFAIGGEQGGIELNSVIGPRAFAAVGVTEGADEGEEAKKGKDYYGHFALRIGGTDYLGKEPEVDLDRDSLWDYLTVTLGGFVYVGNSAEDDYDFSRTGLESEVLYRRLKVRLGGYFGNDDPAEGGAIDSSFYLAQGQYLIGSSLMPSLRLEYADDGAQITRRIIPSLAYTPLQNVKLATEYVYAQSDDTENVGTVRVTFVF